MLPFQGMLHHSAPERSLSIPFSGLWFLCLDLRNVSRTRPGASGDVSSSLCRLDVAWMSPGCRQKAFKHATEEGCFPFGSALAEFLRKKIPGMRFFFVFSPKFNILRSN